ncbi:MAG: hypothetical protein LBD03_09710 [Methanobrevibacter sp.]|jgi:hypothetical protein|nr:hypothetical protein [Candidatus Methanovirga procula]
MFKKFLSLMIIALLAISSVGFVGAIDTTNKYLTVYAKTQDNDGDGVMYLYDLDDELMEEIPIKR